MEILSLGCNFVIIFEWWKFFFTSVIFNNFSQADFIFHGQVERFFQGLYQDFTGKKPKIVTGRHIFCTEENTDGHAK